MRRGASVMLSIAVRCGNSSKCWKTIPIRRRYWRRLIVAGRSGQSPTRSPRKKSLPRVGSISRLKQRISVVLPDPLGPTTQTFSPSARWKSMPSSTRVGPNAFSSPCTSSSAAPGRVTDIPGDPASTVRASLTCRSAALLRHLARRNLRSEGARGRARGLENLRPLPARLELRQRRVQRGRERLRLAADDVVAVPPHVAGRDAVLAGRDVVRNDVRRLVDRRREVLRVRLEVR